jgi:O-antigen ligase
VEKPGVFQLTSHKVRIILPLFIILGLSANSNLFLQSFFWSKTIVLLPLAIFFVAAALYSHIPKYLFLVTCLLILRAIYDSVSLHRPIPQILIGRFESNDGLFIYIVFIGFLSYGVICRSVGINSRMFMLQIFIVCLLDTAASVKQLLESRFMHGQLNDSMLGICGNVDFNAGVLFIGVFLSNYLRSHKTGDFIKFLFLIFETISLLLIFKSHVIHVIIVLVFFYSYKLLRKHVQEKKGMLFWGLISIAISTFLFFSALGYGPLGVRLQQISLMIRVINWRVALRAIFSNPLLGFGFDSYHEEFVRYRNSSTLNALTQSQIPDSPHNLILNLLIDFGLVGFILFVALIVSALKVATSQDTWDDELKAGVILIGMISLAVPFNIVYTSLGCMLLGFLIGSSRSIDRSRRMPRILAFLLIPLTFFFVLPISRPDYQMWKAERIAVDPDTLDGYTKRQAVYQEVMQSRFTQEGHYLLIIDDLLAMEKYSEAFSVAKIARHNFKDDAEIEAKYFEVAQTV